MRMKKLFYFLTALFSLTVIGCVKEDNVSQEQPMVYIDVPVSVGENDDSPDTKSLVSIDVEDFQKAAIFAFKASNGTILPNPDGDPLVTTTSEKSFTWSLPANVAMNVYVISNYGDLDLSSYFTNKKLKESDLQALKFTCSNQEQLKALEEKGHGLPMAGVSERVVINAQNNTLNLKVKKLFSRYDIYFDKSAFKSKGYTINALYISASKSNTEVPYFVEGFQQTDLSKLNLVDLGTSADIVNLNEGDKAHAVTLYFLENCQGTKSGATKWYEVAGSSMDGLNLCSYVDIGIKATDPNGNDANFFYWVYLGTGSGACVSDFNVKRNEKHTLKLTLKTPDEIPATQGIVFTRKNTTSIYQKVRQGSSLNSYANFSLPFETNLSSSETTYEIVGFKNYDTQIGSSVFSNQVIKFNDNSDYFETKYPNAGTFGFRVRASQNQVLNNPITVRIGKKSGDSWVVYDECTVLVYSSSTTYSLEISGETSANVGSTVNLTAKYYTITNGEKDSGVDVTNSASWSVSGVGSVSKGAVTSSTAGTAQVTATYLGESALHNVIFTGSTPPPSTVTWRMKSLSITPSSIQVGGSTTSYSAIKEKYVNGVASGETAAADVTGWSSSSTSIATVSGGTVTGVAEGKATITVTDSSCESGYTTASTVVTVTAAPPVDVFDHYEYENVNVEIWSTVSNNFPVGGTSYTIKATASATRYEVWTVSGRKVAGETVTATPHISGGGGAFTSIDEDSSSVDCSVGANTGAQRSAKYTATARFGEDPYAKSGSASCMVIQEAYVNPDHFEWIDTEISMDAGGTATAQFYSSTNSASISSYTTSVIENAVIEPDSYTLINSGSRKYKGTATITARSTAGGTSGTVTGAVGSSNDQLKVTIERPYYIISIVIEGPSEITPEYPQDVQYNCIVRARTPQGTKTFYSNRNPEYFTWSSEQFTLVDNDTGTFNVRSATAGTLKCTFNYSGELSGTADYFVKQVNSATQIEYEYVSAETEFVKNWADGRAEWKVVVKMRESGTSNYAYIDLTSSSFAGNNELRAVWEWNYANNVWQTGDHLIPSGAQFRVKVYYKGSLMWTSQVHNN